MVNSAQRAGASVLRTKADPAAPPETAPSYSQPQKAPPLPHGLKTPFLAQDGFSSAYMQNISLRCQALCGTRHRVYVTQAQTVRRHSHHVPYFTHKERRAQAITYSKAHI